MDVRDFLRWYNGDLSRRVEADCRPRRGTRAEGDARRYLTLCDRWSVDPQRLAMARQDAVKWRFRVSIQHLCKTTAAFREKFVEWGDNRQAEEVLQARTTARTVDDNRDGPNPLSEEIRRAHQMERDVCMTLAVHNGYDPASQWCPTCPVRRACHAARWPDAVH